MSARGPWGGNSGGGSAPAAPPLGVLRLIGDTLRLLGAHFFFLFPIAFVPSLALVVVDLAAGTGEPIAIDPETGAPPPDLNPVPYLISFLLNVVVASVISGVMCLAALDAVIGKRHTVGEYLRQTLRHLGPIVVLGTILYVLAGIGLVLFILPGLYVLARYWPWIATIVFEDAGWSGFSRAQELTEGYRLPLIGAIALFALLGAVILFFLMPFAALGAEAGAVLHIPIAAAVSAIFYALIAVFIAMVYARLREIKEGMSPADIAATIE
jgi:hypothetical protein